MIPAHTLIELACAYFYISPFELIYVKNNKTDYAKLLIYYLLKNYLQLNDIQISDIINVPVNYVTSYEKKYRLNKTVCSAIKEIKMNIELNYMNKNV